MRAPESVHQTYLIVRRQRATFYDPNIARACLVPKQPQTAASLQELKNFIGPARSSRGSRYPLDGGLGLEKKAVKAQTGRWRGATRPPQARSEKKAYYRYARCIYAVSALPLQAECVPAHKLKKVSLNHCNTTLRPGPQLSARFATSSRDLQPQRRP